MMEPPLSRFLHTHARSIGEIFFLRSWKFGAFLWCAFLILHPLACGIATAALLGAAAVNRIFRISLSDDERQISSLNAFLTGIACGFYFGPHTGLAPLFWCAGALVLHQIVLYALVSTLPRYLRLPVLTLPFVITTVVMVSALRPTAPVPMPAAWTDPGALASALLDPWLPDWLVLFFRSLGTLLFVNDGVLGLVIASTVVIYSRILFSLGLATFLLLLPLRSMLPVELPFELAAFNCMVTVMMIGAVLEVPSRWSYRNAFLFGAVTLMASLVLARLVSPLLNLPFVVTILSYLATRQAIQNEGSLPFDFTAGTPEQNLYYARNKRDRYAGVALAPFGLPFNGEWLVTQGHDGPHTHREAWRHAWDFEITLPDRVGSADRAPLLSDFPAHGRAVCAALEGEVVAVQNAVPENQPGQFNFGQNWGNTVILRHRDGTHTAYSHLSAVPGPVFTGRWLQKGEVLGYCGNSGRSGRPHLHFQFQATGKIGEATLHVPFKHYLLRQNQTRELQTREVPRLGDLVSNVVPSIRLVEAFRFPFARELRATGQWDGVARAERWISTVDLYNHTYLYCHETQGVAYFFSEDGVFYFTDYFGPRSSFLNAFALAAAKVLCSEEGDVVYSDRLQLNRVDRAFTHAFIDLAAPLVNVKDLEARYSISTDPDRTVRLHNTISSIHRIPRLRRHDVAALDVVVPYGTQSIRVAGSIRRSRCSFTIV